MILNIYEAIDNCIFREKMKFFFFLLLSTYVFSSEIILECNIKQELENNRNAISEVYKDKKLFIYIDKINLWVSDITFSDWKIKYKKDFERIEYYLEEDEKNYFFKYRVYFSNEKKKLQQSSNLMIKKFGGYLEFVKYYHDYKNNIFFSSEVRGNCVNKKE